MKKFIISLIVIVGFANLLACLPEGPFFDIKPPEAFVPDATSEEPTPNLQHTHFTVMSQIEENIYLAQQINQRNSRIESQIYILRGSSIPMVAKVKIIRITSPTKLTTQKRLITHRLKICAEKHLNMTTDLKLTTQSQQSVKLKLKALMM